MRHPLLSATVTAGLVLALTGCAPGVSSPTTTAAIGKVDLSDVCPATIVVQTDWNPSAEHGFTYEMLGPDPVIDKSALSVKGPLYAHGEYTGVNIEIRAGGPAVGYQTVESQLYADPSITLGYVQTDGQIMASDQLPTVSVMAPLEVSPQIIMWDPATYPDITRIEQLKDTNAMVRYFTGAPFMEYLVQSGQLRREQTDGSYTGTPANFVAAGGKDAQQGFASSEPYLYEKEIADWGKPVAYQLVSDAGYENYTGTMAVRADALPELDACLTKLVPVMQQAEVDFYADPEPVLDLIVKAVDTYDDGIVYTRGAAEFGTTSVLADGLVSNGDNSTIGDFDDDRMKRFFSVVAPIASAVGSPPADGLTADDLYTNRFIDPSIGLPTP